MTIEELVDKSGMIKFVYKVTPEVYYSFQRCSNDYNPLHTDKMYAEEKVHYISKTFVYFRNIA